MYTFGIHQTKWCFKHCFKINVFFEIQCCLLSYTYTCDFIHELIFGIWMLITPEHNTIVVSIMYLLIEGLYADSLTIYLRLLARLQHFLNVLMCIPILLTIDTFLYIQFAVQLLLLFLLFNICWFSTDGRKVVMLTNNVFAATHFEQYI